MAGVRVVELSDTFTSVGARLLAELGADVIVVEPPDGAPQRRRPPFVDDVPGPNRSLRWWAGNVGKRSVTVDLDVAEGTASLRRLLATADVVVEGAGRALDRIGVGYEHARAALPSVVWVSVTPFGRDSARREEPVTDLTMLANGGQVWNCGYDDHTIPPVRGAGDQSVNIAGQYAAIGALIALAHRERAGRGQLVDVNVNAACNVSCEQVTYNWLLIQATCTRQTGRHAYYAPTAPVQVRCADGAYATTGVLPRDPADFGVLHRWLDELGLADQLPEAFFLEIAAQRDEPFDLAVVGVDAEVTAILGAARDAMTLIAANLPAKEFFLQTQRRGVPTGAVLSPDEAFEDEHFRERGFRRELEHPELGMRHTYPGAPYLFAGAPVGATRRPPLVGEHNDELLGQEP